MSQDTATAHTQTITRSAQIHASATSGYVPAPSWAGGGTFVTRSLEPSTLTLLTLPRRGDPKPAPKPRKKEKRSPRHTQRRRK